MSDNSDNVVVYRIKHSKYPDNNEFRPSMKYPEYFGIYLLTRPMMFLMVSEKRFILWDMIREIMERKTGIH